jgi:hypothetical protein
MVFLSSNFKEFTSYAVVPIQRLFNCFMHASEVEALTFGIGKEGNKHNDFFWFLHLIFC